MATPSRQPLIEVRSLVKSIGWQQILRGLDLTIYKGETLVLIGPSGEGKSVLLKHLIGLMKPNSGEVIFEGQNLVPMKEREVAKLRTKIGYLFQSAALFDSLSVEENVAFPLYQAGLRDPVQIASRVHEALDLVELEEHKGKMPINLSGGMRKRVGIARAIVARPDIILYDEPTAGLDPIVTDVIDRMIQRMHDRFGVTSVVVTHDMGSVFKIADRVGMLKKGVIRFLGTPQELRDCPDKDIQDFIQGRSEYTIQPSSQP